MDTISILAILLTLTPYSGDRESIITRTNRLITIANAIHYAVDNVNWMREKDELIALLIDTGFSESHYASHVHANLCRTWECDKGKAKGPWQIQIGNGISRELWNSIVDTGQESTNAAALGAAIVLSNSYKQCKSLSGTIAGYLSGHCDSTPQVLGREKSFVNTMKLVRRMKEIR